MWRGIVYTVLMAFGKLLTGMWLVRFDLPSPRPLDYFNISLLPSWCCWGRSKPRANKKGLVSRKKMTQLQGEAGNNIEMMAATESQQQVVDPECRNHQSHEVARNIHQKRTKTLKPLSLYPASIIGTAMISRGEIGFLIASIAESRGIFASTSFPGPTARGGSSEIYLIVIWAVILCTIIGPVSVGTLTRRLKKFQTKERSRPSNIDPPGIWGVI